MPKVHHITTDDGAVVEVTSGTEYGAREVIDVTTLQANRQELLKQAATALDNLQAIIDRPEPTFNNLAQALTQVTALQDDVQYNALVLKRLVRLVANQLGAVD